MLIVCAVSAIEDDECGSFKFFNMHLVTTPNLINQVVSVSVKRAWDKIHVNFI